MKFCRNLFFLFVAVILSQCNPSRQTDVPDLIHDNDDGGLNLPDGFHALVVADNLGRGRHIDINENGDIYLALRSLNNGKGIVAIRDTTGDGRADVIKYFGNFAGTGMEIKNKQIELLKGKKLIRNVEDPSGNILFTEGSVLSEEDIRHAQEVGPGILVGLSMNVEA